MVSAHLIISGKVQGVFFRATAKKIAEKYGLTGWVKNTGDGDVETIISGNEEEVKRFIEWCSDGPENAKVENVNVAYIEETFFKEFKVKRE